jgi:branched-chain amino acid transport system substrate-binding protein
MTSIRLSKLVAAGCLGITSLAIAACGGDDSADAGAGAKSSAKTLTVYISLPLQGESRTRSIDMERGAKIALKQAGNAAGPFKIKLVTLDNSTAATGKWEPGATTAAASKAARDESTIAYLGELNSGASALSIPVLNEVGILQVSAANTAVGLTRAEGAEPGEPDKYYPTGKRTYARVVPADHLQAAASAQYMKDNGCTSVYILDDNEVYGQGLAKQVQSAAPSAGVEVKDTGSIDPKATNFRAIASRIKDSGADCFYYGGITANNAVHLFKDINVQNPSMKLFGPDGIGDADFSENIGPEVEKQVYITLPTLPPDQYPPAGQALIEEMRKAKGGSDPDTYALYAYEAMSAIIQAVKDAGDQGDDRGAVVEAFFNIKDRESVLGTYSIDENGDTTLKSYGGNRIKDGRFVFDKVIGV